MIVINKSHIQCPVHCPPYNLKLFRCVIQKYTLLIQALKNEVMAVFELFAILLSFFLDEVKMKKLIYILLDFEKATYLVFIRYQSI